MNRTQRERYESEIAYFDREAEAELSERAPVDPLVVQRYAGHKRRRFSKEYRLRMLGRLERKRVLEIGCGSGESAVVLAKLGAYVTGIDISPKSIELANERARLSGVADRCVFACTPLTKAALPEGAFDVVWGDGILHHLIHELDEVMQKVATWSRPGAVAVFAEPVNLSPTFRKLRLMLPIPPEGTPDERPLEPAELEIVRRTIPEMRVRPFLFLSRLSKFIFDGTSYERADGFRRGLASTLCAIDWAVLTMPVLRRLAGQYVIYGEVAKPASARAA